MGRTRINIETESDVRKFSNIVNNINSRVDLVGNDGVTECRVNAKSIIGAMYAMTWNNLWVESEEDIYDKIKDFASY